MTYEDLVQEVVNRTCQLNKAELVALKTKGAISDKRIERIIRATFVAIRERVVEGGGEAFVPGFGRFVARSIRTSGVQPNGVRWTKTGRSTIGFRPSRAKAVKSAELPGAANSNAA